MLPPYFCITPLIRLSESGPAAGNMLGRCWNIAEVDAGANLHLKLLSQTHGLGLLSPTVMYRLLFGLRD